MVILVKTDDRFEVHVVDGTVLVENYNLDMVRRMDIRTSDNRNVDHKDVV